MSIHVSNLAVPAAIQNAAGREILALNSARIYSVGRAQHADLQLRSPQTSKIHAAVFWDGRCWQLVDCSANGTQVNGREIRRRALAAGDLIRFPGEPELKFTLVSDSSSVKLPPLTRRNVISWENTDAPRRWSIVGSHPTTTQLRQDVVQLAENSSPVLVSGEYGVGKRHLARALHCQGPRHHRALVMVDCAAVEPTDLQEELRPWLTSRATIAGESQIGTVVLDGVEELSGDSQTALLDLLEENAELRQSGNPGNQLPRFVSLAIADTDGLLPEEALSGPLLARLAVAQLFIDPLRARREDIPDLAGHFYRCYANGSTETTRKLSRETLSRLSAYDWPANVAELRNAVERAAMLAGDGPLDTAAFDKGIGAELRDVSPYCGMSIEEVERRHIANTLKNLNWRKSRVARVLGIERSTLDRKIKRYEIQRDAAVDPES